MVPPKSCFRQLGRVKVPRLGGRMLFTNTRAGSRGDRVTPRPQTTSQAPGKGLAKGSLVLGAPPLVSRPDAHPESPWEAPVFGDERLEGSLAASRRLLRLGGASGDSGDVSPQSSPEWIKHPVCFSCLVSPLCGLEWLLSGSQVP